MKKVMLLVGLVTAMLFVQGCPVTATRRAMGYDILLPAGVLVTNNVANTKMTIHSSRMGTTGEMVPTGSTIKVPIAGHPQGSNYVLTAKFYSNSGVYLGMTERSFSIWFDGSGRYSDTWIINSYDEPTKYNR